jgi:hypothetical protein
MPNLSGSLDAILVAALYVLVVLLIVYLVRVHVHISAPRKVRPAVLAAAQRGLHQRDQRRDGE